MARRSFRIWALLGVLAISGCAGAIRAPETYIAICDGEEIKIAAHKYHWSGKCITFSSFRPHALGRGWYPVGEFCGCTSVLVESAKR